MAHPAGPHGTPPRAERRQGAPRYWDRIATQYDSGFDRIAGADLVTAVQTSVAKTVPAGDAVELGCGTGLFTRAYAPGVAAWTRSTSRPPWSRWLETASPTFPR